MHIPDLSLFSRALPVGDDPSMDTADAEFQGICDMANAGDFGGASERIAPLLERGVYDIRLASIVFVQSFEARGWAGLPELLGAMLSLLGENREAFGPQARRDTHFDKRLAWTFERITDLFTYHAAKKDETLARWDAEATPEQLAVAIERGRALSARLGELAYTEAGQRFGAISRMLAERAEIIRVRTAASAHEHRADDDEAHDEAPSKRAHEPLSAQSQGGPSTRTLAVTERFVDLEARLQAFATLVERRDFERAAVIAESVMSELEAFDPRAYFPGLFAGFYSDLSREIESMGPYMNDRGSPKLAMLRQLLRVDLAKYLERG